MSEERFDFHQLDAHDGFKIELVKLPHELSLHFKAQYKGEMVNPGTIDAADSEKASVQLVAFNRNAVTEGVCDRLRLCLEAVARYLTTGGYWADLGECLYQMKELAPQGIRYEGWYYHSGYPVYDEDTDEITYQHVFVSAEDAGPMTPAFVWVEDAFIDPRTLGQVLREVQDEEEAIQERYLPSAGA